jgi:hypothetical protein
MNYGLLKDVEIHNNFAPMEKRWKEVALEFSTEEVIAFHLMLEWL